MHSPGEVRVHDSYRNVTGSVNGDIKEEIPYSYCDWILITDPDDSYFCQVAGIDDGTYSLVISSIGRMYTCTFQASDISTSPGAIHEYYIDWDALAAGQQGVVLQVDGNGDGIFERRIMSDNDLTSEEFALQIQAVIDIQPDTMNLSARGRWVTCYIELPGGFDVNLIDGETVQLEGIASYIGKEDWAKAEANQWNITDHDEDGIPERMVKFDSLLVQLLQEPGDATLSVYGELIGGTSFEGADSIRVIDPRSK